MAEGVIIKGIAGFYYVYVKGLGVLECRARGLFRKEGITPMAGDRAEVTITSAGDFEGNIERILKRKSALDRPAVANADQALLVFAPKSPDWSEVHLDKALIRLERCGVKPVICFNKLDLAEDDFRERISGIYNPAGYELLFISAKNETGIGEVSDILRGKTTVLTGPSGVGKSTLVNLLVSRAGMSAGFQFKESGEACGRQKGDLRLFMDTGEISKKLGRGKNTTRHAQWIPLSYDTFIFDTPGFSAADLTGIKKDELVALYPDFARFEPLCRFAGCSHIAEPDCGVKQALSEGKISRERYNIYREFYKSL